MPVQAILFDNKKWTEIKAKKYLKDRDIIPIKPVHKTTNFLRYRLQDPSLFKSFYIKN